MQNNQTSQQSMLQQIMKKRWVRVSLILLVLSAVFLIALPHIVRLKLESWLVENGAQSATIQKVRLNMFAGSVGIDGLQVKLNDNMVLGDSSFNINLRLLSLLKKEVHLHVGKLTDLVVDIEQSADGTLRIGSITLPSSETETEEKIEEKDVSWFFRASHVELENCVIQLTLPKMQQVILIEQAVLENLFTGKSDQYGSLKLKATVNETPILIDLDKLSLTPALLTEGHIKIDGYNMADLQQILAEVLDPFAGSVSLDGKVHFSMVNHAEIFAQYDGEIIADTIDNGNKHYSTQTPSVSYSGNIQYQQNLEDGILIDVNGLLQGEDISVGVPAANLDLMEKHLQLDGKTKITVKNGVAIVSDATLGFADLNLDLPQMNVKHSGLNWGGQVDYHIGEDKSNLQLSGTLTGKNINLQMPELLELSEETLSITGTTTLHIAPDLQVSYDGDINLGPTNVTISDIKASGKQIGWQGQVGYQLEPQTVRLNGQLIAKDLQSLLEEKHIHITQQDILTRYDYASLQIGEQFQYKGDATLQAENLQVESAGSPALTLGATTVTSLAGTPEGGLHVENVTLNNLDVPATDTQPVTVSIPEIVVHSISSSDFTGAAVESVEIKQPIVRDSKNKTMLAKLESLTGSKINIDQGKTISVASLSSGNGFFLQKDGDNEKPQVTLGGVQAEDITWSTAQGLFCDKIELDSLFGTYTRIKSADDTAQQPEQASSAVSMEKEQVDERTAAIPIQINNINVTGKSGFSYFDQATSTPFETNLDLETFHIKNINSAQPETPFTFLVKGKINQYAPLDIQGSCAPFSEKFLLDSKILLRNGSLARFSPYIIDSIGTRFISGQLDITSQLKVSGGELNLDNNLLFKQLESETVQKQLQDELNKRLPVSLDTALSLLRDKNGNIELKVPLSGPISDLNVNITDIVITAFSNAIMKGVTPYLAYTVLGPTGALAFLGMKTGLSLIKTDLPELKFTDGSSEITVEHTDQLDVVGKHIEKDTEQVYSICANALVWELAGDVERNLANQKKITEDVTANKALFAIADERAKNVQDYLVQNFSIEKERLLICAPTLNFDAEGKPSVNFMK